MEALFTIIYYSIGNMFLGVLLTLIGIALMFFLIRSWFRNKTFTLLSFIIGGILFIFLSFQSILLCGAITVKSYTPEVEYFINNMVSNLPDDVYFDREDSQFILDKITEELPLVGYFVNQADFSGHTPENIAFSMADELKSYMNYFILRRLLWSILFVVVGAATVIKTMENMARKRYRNMSGHTVHGMRSLRSRRNRDF